MTHVLAPALVIDEYVGPGEAEPRIKHGRQPIRRLPGRTSLKPNATCSRCHGGPRLSHRTQAAPMSAVTRQVRNSGDETSSLATSALAGAIFGSAIQAR